MIAIKSISGEMLLSVPVLKDAVSHEELMVSDYVHLTWDSERGDILPAGAYVEYEGERYSLLEPYKPSMQNESAFRYSPQFHSRIIRWQKIIVPVYTYSEDGATIRSRELDWSFTGTPADLMSMIQRAIMHETGEAWNFSIAEGLKETVTVSAQSSSIWSVLSDLAEQCETEWWADKAAHWLYLSKCSHGVGVTLEVGRNVRVPSVISNREEYYTRFYAFGSSRNITQSEGVVQGSIINKRLCLDTRKYPNGYKDIKGHFEDGVFVSDLLPEEVMVKSLYFEDIYPSSPLALSEVRRRMRYRTDDDGNKVRIGGDEENPVYEQYAIWYFKLKDFEFTEDLIIEGKTLSVAFKTGRLQGREFELTYHPEAKKVSDNADVDKEFAVEAGEYEINFDKSNGMIIPDDDYIVPAVGDEVVLFNNNMPDEYKASAQLELEKKLDEAIGEYVKDNDSYEFESNPVAFHEEGADVHLGQSVTFIHGGSALETRVLMVEKRLDHPFEQKIRVGNVRISGSRKQLTDEVRNISEEVGRMGRTEAASGVLLRDHTRDLMLTMGRYFAMSDTIKMLQEAVEGYTGGINPVTVETMAMLVGDESLQYRFTASRNDLTPLENCPLVYDATSKQLNADPCALIHMTLGITSMTARDVRTAADYRSWNMEEWHSELFEDAEKAYYVYAVVEENGDKGTYAYYEKPKKMREINGVLHLLVGILNVEYVGTRELITLYGFTEVLPGQITTDVIRSADGNSVLDLVSGLLTFGAMVGLSGQTAAEGENLRIWAGKGETERDNAPFRVYDNGSVYASLLHLLNGCRIGNAIQIEDGKMVIDIPDNNAKVKISEDGIIAEGFCTAAIGHCGGAGVQGFANGSELSCPNVDDGVGVQGEAKNGGYAFYSTGGMFGGLRPNTRVINSSGAVDGRVVLMELDFSVLVYLSSGVCYLRLPSTPQDGQEYHIETHGASLNIIASHPTWMLKTKSVVSANTAFTHDGSGILRLKFYKQVYQWQCTTI